MTGEVNRIAIIDIGRNQCPGVSQLWLLSGSDQGTVGPEKQEIRSSLYPLCFNSHNCVSWKIDRRKQHLGTGNSSAGLRDV